MWFTDIHVGKTLKLYKFKKNLSIVLCSYQHVVFLNVSYSTSCGRTNNIFDSSMSSYTNPNRMAVLDESKTLNVRTWNYNAVKRKLI